MTARQPPGEKGAKACTIGYDLSRDGYFCAYFSGVIVKRGEILMKNGARYKVKTRYGWFSLDEGSYQDYLKGRLWINWPPEKKPGEEVQEALPPKVGKRALELREQADRYGWKDSADHCGGIHVVPLPYVERLASISIAEMDLTVRSSNGLMRAGLSTFDKLMARMNSEGGIQAIRNLGTKSALEIREAFGDICYTRLLPYEKAQYWQNVIEKNCP